MTRPPSLPVHRSGCGAAAGFWLAILHRPAMFRALPLGERLWFYRHAVEAGCIASVAEGVTAMAAAYARWRTEVWRQQPTRLREREWQRDQKRWRIARAKVPPGDCRYCGAPDVRGIDHVIPRSQGGTHDLANLVRCCDPCNSSKGGRTPEQWRRGEHVEVACKT